jgi:uncharacterized protein YbbK (DUF523 family)/uncharacterized protein YbgA (DUF1722 family)
VTAKAPDTDELPRPRIGVSSCLLGERVRYDGGHKRDAFVTDTLGPYVDWVPVCPELEVGLGVPRDPLHLSNPGDGIHLVVTKTGEDITRRMTRFSDRRLKDIAKLRLSGYILKSKSPSCGMERVRVYRRTGILHKAGRGVFAEALIATFPHLPVEEEGRLSDMKLRENFVSRVYAHYRWQQMSKTGVTRARLMKFHETHKFVLMSHSQTGARELSALVGRGATSKLYLDKFAEVMKRPPTRKNHANVLQHLAGFLQADLDGHDRRELGEVIDRYRRELLPLIVPITLLRHYAVKCGAKYLNDQVYLSPHPHELMLLNHV